ncbi:MAG: RIP metalloprotease RseP [Bacteroidales bacterium]|nr:RIP metalloprotease RseP [Bacteroidales bacterium]
MTVLLKIFQVILALSVLILIHEFGHFIFSKIFGVRVEKFYLFFDVGSKRIFSTKNSRLVRRLFPKLADSETDYGIGWLPLGGYCKISGMIDESLDTEQMKRDPQPWEFRTKPAWQRLLIMFGGVLMNFLLAIFIYIGMLAAEGESYVSNDGAEIYVNELSKDMGFRSGDHIISFDDYCPDNFSMLQADLARRDVSKAVVLRDGDTLDIYIDHSRIGEVLESPGMFALAIPFVIDSIPPTSPNYQSDLRPGDRILSVGGEPVGYVQDSREILRSFASSDVDVVVERDTSLLDMALAVDSLGLIGVYTRFPYDLVKSREYGFLEAIPAGVKLTFSTIGGYIRDLKLVFTPSTEAYKSVGSFISIGQVFPDSWNWIQFLNILALLSVMLGVMNLIPIPGLDGGHILFTLYEIVFRRKPGDRFLLAAQYVGMILLIALMILAFGNDIGRLIK